jgi:hypothetical protein
MTTLESIGLAIHEACERLTLIGRDHIAEQRRVRRKLSRLYRAQDRLLASGQPADMIPRPGHPIPECLA